VLVYFNFIITRCWQTLINILKCVDVQMTNLACILAWSVFFLSSLKNENSFTHPHVIPNVSDFIPSAEHKRRYSEVLSKHCFIVSVVASWPARPKNIETMVWVWSGTTCLTDQWQMRGVFEKPVWKQKTKKKRHICNYVMFCNNICSAEITALTSDHELKWSGLLVLQCLQAKA